MEQQQSGDTPAATGSLPNSRVLGGSSRGGSSAQQTETSGSGGVAARGVRAGRRRKPRQLDRLQVVDIYGRPRPFLDEPLSSSSSGSAGSSSPSSSEAGTGESSLAGGSSSGSDSEEYAAWLPWVQSFLPRGRHSYKQLPGAQAQPCGTAGGGGGGGSGSDSGEDEDEQLSRSRLLLRRQRERDLRRGRWPLPAWQTTEGWQQALQPSKEETKRSLYKEATLFQRQLMVASARCLAAVRVACTLSLCWFHLPLVSAAAAAARSA